MDLKQLKQKERIITKIAEIFGSVEQMLNAYLDLIANKKVDEGTVHMRLKLLKRLRSLAGVEQLLKREEEHVPSLRGLKSYQEEQMIELERLERAIERVESAPNLEKEIEVQVRELIRSLHKEEQAITRLKKEAA